MIIVNDFADFVLHIELYLLGISKMILIGIIVLIIILIEYQKVILCYTHGAN